MDEKDVFETDLDVPAFEARSDSKDMVLDDEETSDFDLALTDDLEESDNEAIALDEDEDAEEDDDQPRKMAEPTSRKAAVDDEVEVLT